MNKFVVMLLSAFAVANAYKSGGFSSGSSFHSSSSSFHSSSSSYKPSTSSYKTSSSSSYKPSTSSYKTSSSSSYSPKTSNANTVTYKPTTASKPTTTAYKTTSNGYKTSGSYNTNGSSYKSYNRPISRQPSWYSNSYHFHFNSGRYNSGYNYYPIYADPWHGNLAAMTMGALVTYMILENGSRQPIYADGTGSAYTMVNGDRVLVAQDDNGNWAQLSPNTAVGDGTPVQVAPTNTVVVEKKTMGGWGVFGVLCFIGILGVVGYFLYILFREK